MYKTVLNIALVIVTVVCTSIDCDCIFEGEKYSVGTTWHPPTFGTCVNCTCKISASGKPDVRCINTADKCPKVTCDSPKRDPHTCCPYCEDLPNIPPTVRADDDESSSSKRSPCTTPSGRIYQDGERYCSNSTGIRPTSDNQYVMCVCQNGRSRCQLKTCQVPATCSSFVESEDGCCPVCADKSKISAKDPEMYETIAATDSLKSENDCSDAGGIKKNGSSWIPNIAPFGEIDCFTCTCMNGEITCKKVCLPDHKLPCQHPKKPNGECCKTCPDGDDDDDKPKRRHKTKKRDRKRNGGSRKGKRKHKKRCKGKNKGKKRCRKRKNRKQRTTPAELTAITTASPGIDLDNLCRKKKTKYLLYKNIGQTEMFIAFDDIEADTVDVYKWTINKGSKRGVVTYTGEETVPSPDFRRKINNTNVVGTTGKKQYRKFKRRLKDKLEKCKENCEPELFIKIQKKVKVHLLKFGEQCKT